VNFEDEYSAGTKEDYYLYGTHGYGHVWYDKSMSFVSFTNGEIITMFEHSSMDGLVMTAGKDYTTIEEFYHAQDGEFSWFEKKGLISDERAFNTGSFREAQMISGLEASDLEVLQEDFHKARTHLTENAMDIRVGHMLAEDVDRKIAKRVKVSPDAMIQCGLQLAFYRIHQKFVLSYQPATLQHYAYGRTENIRPLTARKVAFVKSMGDDSVEPSERYRLLKLASDEHSDITKQAMAMKGVDRHLFALYIIMKGQGYESDFLEFAMNDGAKMPLCTSCLPNKTLDRMKKVSRCDQDWMKSPSAGVFRNQDQDGYGIFYMEADQNRTKFVVTSSASCETTDPIRFCQTLKQSLADITGVMESQLDPTLPVNPPIKPPGAS
jgi:carnitine O-palmitoyltransferase 1